MFLLVFPLLKVGPLHVKNNQTNKNESRSIDNIFLRNNWLLFSSSSLKLILVPLWAYSVIISFIIHIRSLFTKKSTKFTNLTIMNMLILDQYSLVL